MITQQRFWNFPHSKSSTILLRVQTAMRLFEAKILPTLTYGIEIIWEHLTERQLKSIESLKARFLKRAMALSKYTLSRLTYMMAWETFLLEDLMFKHLLQRTAPVTAVLQDRRGKQEEIWDDFFVTEAMTTDSWKTANYELRHMVTRLAVHGFHDKVCRNKKYHTPMVTCVCELCERPCERYHILTCANRSKHLSEYARE